MNTTKPNEDPQKLHERYLNDLYLRELNKRLSNIYAVALPTIIYNAKSEELKITYSEETKKAALGIRQVMADYIRRHYPELSKTV